MYATKQAEIYIPGTYCIQNAYIPGKSYLYNMYTKHSGDGFGVQVLTIFEATSWQCCTDGFKYREAKRPRVESCW